MTLLRGARMTFSTTEIGYSAGGTRYRVTRRADGRAQQTLSIPGTERSYVSRKGHRTRQTAPSAAAAAAGTAITEAGLLRAARRQGPLPRGPDARHRDDGTRHPNGAAARARGRDDQWRVEVVRRRSQPREDTARVGVR